MKEFMQVLKRFVLPYKKYVVLSIVFNILSALLNIFSFAALIPILQILFKTGDNVAVTTLMEWGDASFKDVLVNNIYYYINTFITDMGSTTTLLFIGLFLIFATLLKTAAYFLAASSVVPIRTGVVRDMRNQLYKKIVALPLGFFTEERKGDIIARMTGDVQEVETSIMSSLDLMFKNPILIISYFTTLIVISWQLTLFSVIIIPLIGWFMGWIGRKLKAQSIQAQSLWSDTMSVVDETLGGLRIIKAFCAEGKMLDKFNRINSTYRHDIMWVNIRQNIGHPLSEFLGTCMIVIVLWFGGVLVLNDGSLSGPTFIYYMVILYSIINPLKEVSKVGYNIPKGLASMERIDKILLAENTIKEVENPKHIPSFEHQIEFRNVSFRYGEQWVLRDINLTIPKGKTIAIVGQSGSGKSTLVDLIPRYYDVQEGEVLIDGINVKELGIHDLRQLIGNVNQEAILFNDSFRNNISFGVDNATQQQIEEAAKIANAYDFIMASEEGFDTNIGDRGGRLSGGQRQRVSIARAILKNPPILILDEATSALDTESERLVQDALERLMKTRTTVAIAHRLSTIKNADEICVLHEGRIVERGTHDELLAIDGHYKKLTDMQALTYLLTMLFFIIAKVAFMLYNSSQVFSASDVLSVLWHGLSLDFSTSLYIISVPFLVCAASIWLGGIKALRLVLRAYYLLIAVAITLAFVADTSLYEFWLFKLDSSCLQYLETPTEAMASVSLGYIVVRIIAIAVISALIWWAYTHPRFSITPSPHRIMESAVALLFIPLIIIGIRGGLGESTTNIGQVYFSQNQFLNHSAVNPVFNFIDSFDKADAEYSFMSDEACNKLMSELYNTQSINSDTLLNTQHPNIIIILLEGCGGEFTEIGGRTDITPNLNKLAKEGIYFTNCYGNTWRTDRGTVCALSGYPSFPTLSVMKIPAKSRSLPNIARTLQEERGYNTSYIYGGDINFTNMRSYLISGGFEHLTWMKDYTAEEQKTAQWGVRDDITFKTLYQMATTTESPFLIGFSTLSSHSPWDVPIRHFDDEVINSFYYLDQCIGDFIQKLRKSEAWKNTLVVMLPDHGIPHDGLDETTSLLNHIPMIWVGGAVKAPRKIEQVCNQTDLPATLLGQLGISHDAFTFSRDVLSATYTHPFATHTFDNGFSMVDSASFVILTIGKAILQAASNDFKGR